MLVLVTWRLQCVLQLHLHVARVLFFLHSPIMQAINTPRLVKRLKTFTAKYVFILACEIQPLNYLAKVGTYCKAHGTSVSVVSIRGDDCSMENLGLLADITAGQVRVVESLSFFSRHFDVMTG